METKYSKTNDDAFKPLKVDTTIEKVMNDAEEEFLKFITIQCQKMEMKLKFDGQTQPTLYELNTAIMEHEHIMLALTALYEQTRWEVSKAKKKLEEWFALKFIEIRTEVNDPKLAASKWYTKDEINYMIRVKYTKEYALLETEVEINENKRSLLQRLISQWDSYAYQLNQLSKNSMAELNSSHHAGYDEDSETSDFNSK